MKKTGFVIVIEDLRVYVTLVEAWIIKYMDRKLADVT
jgi:hypothetical protein